MWRKIYADNGFAELKKISSELKMDTSQLKSITVGINLNDRFGSGRNRSDICKQQIFYQVRNRGNFMTILRQRIGSMRIPYGKRISKFQPFDVNADAVISTPMQKVMDTAVMRSESQGGIVKLPEGDQAKDVTRYTDRIVNHMISHMVKRVREVLNKYVSITITDMTRLDSGAALLYQMGGVHSKLQEQGFTLLKLLYIKAGK